MFATSVFVLNDTTFEECDISLFHRHLSLIFPVSLLAIQNSSQTGLEKDIEEGSKFSRKYPPNTVRKHRASVHKILIGASKLQHHVCNSSTGSSPLYSILCCSIQRTYDSAQANIFWYDSLGGSLTTSGRLHRLSHHRVGLQWWWRGRRSWRAPCEAILQWAFSQECLMRPCFSFRTLRFQWVHVLSTFCTRYHHQGCKIIPVPDTRCFNSLYISSYRPFTAFVEANQSVYFNYLEHLYDTSFCH